MNIQVNKIYHIEVQCSFLVLATEMLNVSVVCGFD
jgi:hypothetical protein